MSAIKSKSLPEAPPELVALALPILRALGSAWRGAQLYTAGHPSVAEAVARLHAAYTAAMADHLLLSLTFPGAEVAVNDGRIPDPEVGLVRLSAHLHAIGLATVRLAPGATPDHLAHVVEVIATPRSVVLQAGRLDAFIDSTRLGPLRLLPLDYRPIFKVGANGLPGRTQLIDPAGLWYAMITGYAVRAPDRLDAEARAFIEGFATDPAKLRHLADELAHLELDEEWIDLHKVKGTLLANFYRSLGHLLHTGELHPEVATGVAQATERLEAGRLIALVAEVSEGDEGVMDELLAAFRPERVASLFGASGKAPEAEMVRVAQRLLTVHPEKKRILDLLHATEQEVAALAGDGPPTLEALRALCARLGEGEPLDLLHEAPGGVASDYVDQLRSLTVDREIATQLLRDFALEAAEQERAELHLTLIEQEEDSEELDDQLATLLALALSTTVDGRYHATLGVVEGLVALAANDALAPERRARIAAAVAKLPVEEIVALLTVGYTAYGGTPTERDVSRMIGALGERAIVALLDRLRAAEERSERRAIVTLLKNQGERVLPYVAARLHDPAWYFLRNLLHLLGLYQVEESARLVIPLLRHPDLRVVKEALTTLGRIGSRQATPFITQLLLTEPTLPSHHSDDLRASAARALTYLDDPRAAQALQSATRSRRGVVAQACAAALREREVGKGEKP